MRTNADRLAMAAVAVVVLGLVFVRTQQAPTDARSASTHYSGRGGLRALYLTARELDLPVSRWQQPLDLHCKDCPALALVAPEIPLGPREAFALRRRIARGGRLLYVPSLLDDRFLSRLGLELRVQTRVDSVVRPRRSTELATQLLDGTPDRVDGFRQLIVRGDTERADVFVEPLLARGAKRFAAARVLVGNGEIIVFADAAPIANAVIGADGAASLAVRSLAWLAGEDGIAFDEFHHGFDDRVGLWGATRRYLTTTAPGWALLQLAVIAVLAVAAAGIRLGRARELPPAQRRSPLEHADALAAAYTAARATRRAGSLLLDELRLRLGTRTPAAFRARLEALAVTRPALRAAVDDVARHTDGTTTPDLPRLARAIDLLTEEPHAIRP
ncbi:MAG TPA: DUF4350 domain-containing protein [Candidatus Binatia bacterium]|jgi:hypothetical protein|nr:DUF4350 domain-containing protein [Candidatus Binatia bacterium]